MKTPIIEGLTEAGLVSYLNARLFDTLYWMRYFPIKNVNTLDGKTLIGETGSRVAAHVISYDAKAPEASRKSMVTKHFDIPKIAQSRRKTEKEILEHQITKVYRGIDAVVEDYFNDVDFVFDSVQARIEWMILTAMSTGKLQLSVSNNPSGIVNETVIDFGLLTANKKVATTATWTLGNKASMTPIADIKAVVKAARAKGIYFDRMIMHPDAFDLIVASTEFSDACKSLIIGQSQVLGYLGLDTVNAVLRSLNLPPIELIETSVDIEGRDGSLTSANPWDANHVLFVPNASLGNLYVGPIAEEIERPDGVMQAKRNQILISIQRDFNPVSVLTKAESNCFPSWVNVDKCYSLYVNSTSTWA
jgi:hypothetical protein